MSAAFYSFHHFFNELEKAELKNQLAALIKKLIRVDLLVIDDFAYKKVDAKSSEYLYNIVDARYAVKSIILAGRLSRPTDGKCYHGQDRASFVSNHHKRRIVSQKFIAQISKRLNLKLTFFTLSLNHNMGVEYHDPRN